MKDDEQLRRDIEDNLGGEFCEWGKASVSKAEENFLAGPQSRLRELWRILAIGGEFLRGFRGLHFVGPCVTVFGSARFPETHHYYGVAREMGRRLADMGFTIMTGGGPGIMEAANRGAKDVNGSSVGCNIKLPLEQRENPYLDKWVCFNHFFVRKVMLLKYSYAFIVLPGGFGTLDEMYETATLVQTGKIKDFPVVLMGRSYWQPLLDFMSETLLRAGTISAGDLEIFRVTDDPAEAAEIVRDYAFDRAKLVLGPTLKRRFMLFESR